MWIFGGSVWSWILSVGRLMRWLCARYLLMTRGHVRCRRGPRRFSVISSMVSASASASRSGGKTRLVGNLAADCAVASHEGEVVGVGADGIGGVFHDAPYGVMHQQLAIPRKCGDLQLVDLGPDAPFFGPRSAAVRGAPPAAGVRAGRRPPAEAWP